MPTQTSSTGLPTPPTIKGGEEVYDMIMGEIEPDLTTANLKKNEKKYTGETKDELQARMERYKAAFIEYKTRFAEYKTKQDDEVHSYGRNVMGVVEGQSSARDENTMQDLESAISNS